jgi:hypothetical protein
MGRDTTWSGRFLNTFRRKMLPHFSGQKREHVLRSVSKHVGLQCVTSQKSVMFTVIALRISDHAIYLRFKLCESINCEEPESSAQIRNTLATSSYRHQVVF